MFGYIAPRLDALSKEEKSRYSKFYCGLCHELDSQFGSTGSATLTYDMTFLVILLSSVYEAEERLSQHRCIRHPIKSRSYIQTSITSYVARMNILLSYYQALDDWNDEHSFLAKMKSERLKKYLPEIHGANPRQCDAVVDCLKRLSQMEKSSELNPDLPANCFGELMGQLFAWEEDEYSKDLERLGASLGRFVYLLDAANDLRSDIQKQRYNPLVFQLESDFTPMLTFLMADCTAEFVKLPVQRDRHILENHLYAGVWQKYLKRNRKGADANE
jgi:hypothetical protein